MQPDSFLKAVSAFALTLLLPAATALVHGPRDHQHWLEIRGQDTHPAPGNSKHVSPLLIDTFQSPTRNDLGFWHGTGENLTVVHQPGWVRLFPTDPDQNFHTQFDTHGCFSLLPWHAHFLHVVFEGTDQFSVSMSEHNAECNPSRAPFPGVSDSVQASRYLMQDSTAEWNDETPGGDEDDYEAGLSCHSQHRKQHRRPNGCRQNKTSNHAPAVVPRDELYIPLSHFRINHNRVVSVSFTGFYTNEPITLYRVEILPAVPSPSPENNHFKIPEKLPSGELILRCSRPNSFAFGIDDGQPQFAQEVMKILDEENVRVTFFAVGAGLSDVSTNFTNFYHEMLKKGHQVAMHSNTHPK